MTDEVLTTGEAADYLGIGPTTLRRWANDGLVRHTVLPSGRLRFERADLDACLAQRGPGEVGAA